MQQSTRDLFIVTVIFPLISPYQCRCGSVFDTAAESLCSMHTVPPRRRPTHTAAPAPANTERDTQRDPAREIHALFSIWTCTHTHTQYQRRI